MANRRKKGFTVQAETSPDVMGGALVFWGTRVAVADALLRVLVGGEDPAEEFPSVDFGSKEFLSLLWRQSRGARQD